MTGWRWLMRLAVPLAGLLAGCFWKQSYLVSAYGIETPPHDPTVVLTDFSYSPAAPAHAGDTLVFTVTTSKPVYAFDGLAEIRIGSAEHPVAGIEGGLLGQNCRDDGIDPDVTAYDGVSTGRMTIPESVLPQADLPVRAWLAWNDGYNTPELAGPPLDIVEEQE